MGKENKAHTAVANRIAARYGGSFNRGEGPDICMDGLLIEVETTASLRLAIGRLKQMPGPAFVAVTNKEALAEALRIAQNTPVGVMDPHGQIIKQSQPPWEGA